MQCLFPQTGTLAALAWLGAEEILGAKTVTVRTSSVRRGKREKRGLDLRKREAVLRASPLRRHQVLFISNFDYQKPVRFIEGSLYSFRKSLVCPIFFNIYRVD